MSGAPISKEPTAAGAGPRLQQQRRQPGSRPRPHGPHPYQRERPVSGIPVPTRGRTFSGKDGFPEPKPAPAHKKATPDSKLPAEHAHALKISKKMVLLIPDLPSRSSFMGLQSKEIHRSPEISEGDAPPSIQAQAQLLQLKLNPFADSRDSDEGDTKEGGAEAVVVTEAGTPRELQESYCTDLEYETAVEGTSSMPLPTSPSSRSSESRLMSVFTSTVDLEMAALGKEKSKAQLQANSKPLLQLNLERRSSASTLQFKHGEKTAGKKDLKHSETKLSTSMSGSEGFDFGEYFGVTDEKERPYGFESYPFNLMPFPGEKALRVRNWIAFFPCTTTGLSGCFKGTLAIRNTSHVNMAYLVKCSKPHMLEVWEPKSYLNPRQSKEIVVSTKPHGSYNFLQLKTAAFLVLGIPVYFRKQLKPEKIDTLWRAFENGIIPESSVETHEVRRVEPGDQSMTAEFSALSIMGFGNLSPWPWSRISTRLPLTKIGGAGGPLSVDAFCSAWNCVSAYKLALLSEFENHQLKRRISKASKREEKANRARSRLRWTSAGIYTLMLLATVFAGRKWSIFMYMQSLEDVIGALIRGFVNKWSGDSDFE